MILLDHAEELAENTAPTLASGGGHCAAVADRLHRVAASQGVRQLVDADEDIDNVLLHCGTTTI